MVKSGEKWNRKWMVIRVNELGSASSCRVVAGWLQGCQGCAEMCGDGGAHLQSCVVIIFVD